MECLIHSPAFKFDKSQSICQRPGTTKEKPATTIFEKASHETKPLQGRARTTLKPQENDFSRLCKQNQCESSTILRPSIVSKWGGLRGLALPITAAGAPETRAPTRANPPKKHKSPTPSIFWRCCRLAAVRGFCTGSDSS